VIREPSNIRKRLYSYIGRIKQRIAHNLMLMSRSRIRHLTTPAFHRKQLKYTAVGQSDQGRLAHVSVIGNSPQISHGICKIQTEKEQSGGTGTRSCPLSRPSRQMKRPKPQQLSRSIVSSTHSTVIRTYPLIDRDLAGGFRLLLRWVSFYIARQTKCGRNDKSHHVIYSAKKAATKAPTTLTATLPAPAVTT
jgi:hypothetical protein